MNTFLPFIKKEIYTTHEAATILGVTARTIQLWADSGVINVWKTPGGHRRINLEELEKLLNAVSSIPLCNKSEKNMLNHLIVEDDVYLLKLYQLKISHWDIDLNLNCVRDGYEALLMIGETSPDIIITDLHMPNLDGFHMLDVLCNRTELQHTEFIVVTGLSPEEVEERGGIPERAKLFPKPTPFETLASIIHQRSKRVS